MERWIGDTLGALNPGHLTLSLIRPALDLFRSETVAPNLSALMVVSAIVLIAVCWRGRVRPALAVLDQRIAFLKGCDSPSEFYDRIDQFDLLMNESKFLAHGWSEFIETCLFTRKEGKVSVEISIRPAVFINIEDSEHSGLRVLWFHHLSGIFVGVGLLLTFIGLVAALYFSSSAINLVIDGAQGISAAEQTKAVQKALAQLLNTATFKFLTSIAGLGCSIVLGLFQRRWSALLEQRYQELCRELERCTLIVTPEQLANRQHHELCTQSELLRELPARIGPEFARALESALLPVVERLDEANRNAVTAGSLRELKSVAETFATLPLRMTTATDDLQRTLSELAAGIEAFQSRVVPAPDNRAQRETEAALIAELAQTIGRLESAWQNNANSVADRFLDSANAAREVSFQNVARLEDALEKIATAGLRAGEGVGRAALEAKESLDRCSQQASDQLIEGSQQVLGRFGETVDRLWQQIDGLNRALGSVENRIGGHITALDGVNRSTRETGTALAETARTVGIATAPLARVGEVMAVSMDAVSRSVAVTVDTLKESQHQGQNLAADLRDTLQRLQAIWGQHENRFVEVDDSLSRVLTSIIEHVDAHGGALRDHVVKIDTHLAQTVNNLAGNVEALQETAAELTRAVSGIRKLVEALPAPPLPSHPIRPEPVRE
ncbi:MAG: hypothetical protein WCF85_00515 [Rhodospirillaceae bacterium]